MRSDNVSPFYITRPLVSAAVFFGAGVFFGVRVSPSPFFLGLLLLCVLLSCLKKTRFLFLMAAFVAGLLLCAVASHPVLPDEGIYRITGTLRGDAVTDTFIGHTRAELEHVSLNGQEACIAAYWTFYTVKNEAAPVLRDGDIVSFTGRLYHPQGRVNPSGFNFKLYLYQNGMSVGLYGTDDLQVTGHEAAGILYWSRAARCWLINRLSEAMGGDASLAAALALGERSMISQEDKEAFHRTGTAHILAVSGLHLGYFTLLVMFILRMTRVHKRYHWIGLAFFLICYALLTGMSDSVLRAAVLALLLALSRTLRKPYDPLTALAAAFILILAVRPLDLFTPGFILSFTSVLGITLLQKPIQSKMKFLPKALASSLSVSLAASAGIVIPIMYYYKEFQWLSPLINLFMVPLAGIMTLLSLLTLAFPFLGALTALAAQAFLALVRIIGEVPFLTTNAFSPPIYMITGAYLFMALYSGFLTLKGRRRLIAACTAFILAAAGYISLRAEPLQYTLFANSQSDGAVVEAGSYTLVIDAGENGQDMASYLKARGRKVDMLVISHLHADHVNGLKAFLNQGVEITEIGLPWGYKAYQWDEGCLPLIEASGIPIRELTSDDVLPCASVLWPIASKPARAADTNDLSIGLLITLGDVKILSLGDQGIAYENYIARECDILKVSHHGSGGATGEAFLDATSPTSAFITCTRNALLPSEKTLNALYKRGISVYRTDVYGALKVTPHENGYSIQPYLHGGAD